MTLNQLNIFPVFRSLVVNFCRLGGLILTDCLCQRCAKSDPVRNKSTLLRITQMVAQAA